jgi:methyl-accepting chemotaxis protein
MHWTLGRKLGVGFLTVIGLFAICGVLTLRQLSSLAATQRRVVEVDTAKSLAAERLNAEMQHSLASLRGYILVGADPAKGKTMREDRASAWSAIDEQVGAIEQASGNQADSKTEHSLEDLRAGLGEFRTTQDEIEAIAHTPENLPAIELLTTQAAPAAKRVIESISAMIDEEGTLEATKERKALLRAMADTRGSFAVGLASVRAYLLTGDAAHRTDFEGRWETNEQAVATIAALEGLLTLTQKEQWSRLTASRQAFAPLPGQMFEIRAKPDWNKAVYALGTRAAPQARALVAQIGEIREASEASLAEARGRLASVASQTRTLVIGSIAAAGAVGLGISWFLTRSIVGSIRRVLDRSTSIGRGDLTGPPLAITSKDETGALTASVNAMQASLTKLVGELAGSAREVASAATQIAASSEEISRGMGHQQQQVSQVSAAITEMSASVSEVAGRASEVTTKAQHAGQNAREGEQVVQATVADMTEIDQVVAASADLVLDLGKRSEQIGAIVGVINDIADQTNLLALNAAIEAARAGEHGRGFAVVADEVRKLADRTTKATEEIVQSISTIRSQTTKAVDQIKLGTERARAGVTRSTSARTSLHAIVEGTESLGALMAGIAAAAGQQGSVAEEIGRSIDAVNRSAMESATGAEQAAQAAHSLSTKAEELNALVGQFRVA